MRYLKYLALLTILAVPAVYSQAQVSIGVQIGPSYGVYNPPPVCEFGYYPDYPFGCAPYGYWGPEWFVDGEFIGAGPWYRFYYVHPDYWRGYYGRYYVVRRDWDRDDHWRGRRFRDDDDRWRGRRFRDDDDDRRFFRGEGRGHRDNDDFRGNEQGFRGRDFHDRGEFHGDRGREFRGGDDGGRGDHGEHRGHR